MKKQFQARHQGASLTEYMLVLTLIAGVCYVSLTALGISISQKLIDASETIKQALIQ